MNQLLGAMVRMKHYVIVVSLYSQMELTRVSHNTYSLSILIDCFCKLGQMGCGFSVLGKMMKLGVEPNSRIAEALSLFHKMLEEGIQPHLHVYNTILNGLCKTKKVDAAGRFLCMMEDRGFEPNIIAYTAVIDCFCKNLSLKEALSLFSKLKEKRIRPNTITYSCLIKASLGLDQQQVAERLLDEMEDNKILLDVVTYGILVDWIGKKGSLDEAKNIMDTMRKRGIEPSTAGFRGYIKPNIVVYGMIIDALCKLRRFSDALNIIQKMRNQGIEPNVVIYNSLMRIMFLINKDFIAE
ncbi:hypothetical protein GQ457_09G010780 [Hibiscus cannabinus]